MKVALWAEIRRLHEVEGLSQAGHRPPFALLHQNRRQGFDADSRRPQWQRRPRKASSTLTGAGSTPCWPSIPTSSAVRVVEEIARGEDGLSRQRLPGAALSAQVRPVRGRVYQEVLYEPGEAHASRLGRLRAGDGRSDAAAGFGLRGRAVLQPAVLHRVQPLATQGGVLPGVGPRPGVLPGKSAKNHLRQPQGGGAQAVRAATPVCIRSSWPSAATSAWSRSPARHATRNRKGSSRGACGT